MLKLFVINFLLLICGIFNFQSLDALEIETNIEQLALLQPKDCEVIFNTRLSTIMNKDSLKLCLDYASTNLEVKEVNIASTISNVSCEMLNSELLNERRGALVNFVKEIFPHVEVNDRTPIVKHYRYAPVGIVQIGSISNLDFSTKLLNIAHKNLGKASETECLRTDHYHYRLIDFFDEEPKNTFRFHVRTGYDSLFYNFLTTRENSPVIYSTSKNYLSFGGEIAFAHQYLDIPWLRFEVALLGSTFTSLLASQSQLNLYTVYGASGFYFTANEFIFGIRGLFGTIFNEKNQSDMDFGGEVKIGFEFLPFSILLDAGLTKDTTRYGLEIGVIL